MGSEGEDCAEGALCTDVSTAKALPTQGPGPSTHRWHHPEGEELLGEGYLLAEGSVLQGFDFTATGRISLPILEE